MMTCRIKLYVSMDALKKKSFTVVQISPEYLWARSPPETDPLIKLIKNR